MDSPQEWPEPVVPVQTLVDATVIPDRYVKPPSERPGTGVDASKDASVGTIPIVDVGALLSGEAAVREATMRAISDACKEWGFFQVVNHGVSPELMRRAREVWREFFHLPLEEKQVFANSPKTFEGYGSRIGIQKGACLDWGDYFFLHLRPESIKNHDKWPALPASLRSKYITYIYRHGCFKPFRFCSLLQRSDKTCRIRGNFAKRQPNARAMQNLLCSFLRLI